MRWSWMAARWFALIVGLVVGGVVGLAVYGGSRLSGVSLYVLCGTVAGGVAALVFYGFRRAIRLTELTVSIPHLTDLKFAVTPGNTAVAWRLFVESATRVSTQPLDTEAGLLREALNSLYGLFQSIRRILLEAEPSRLAVDTKTVENLAISMINQQMRPFMSRWHPRLASWERDHPDAAEAAWPENAACRAELEQLRLGLLSYVYGLGELAGVADIDSLMASPSPVRPTPTQRDDSGPQPVRGSTLR